MEKNGTGGRAEALWLKVKRLKYEHMQNNYRPRHTRLPKVGGVTWYENPIFRHNLLWETTQTVKVSKSAKIMNRYNQVSHLTQDTNGKVTNSQVDTTNESQEVSPFPAGDHKAHIYRRTQMQSKQKTEKNH